MARSFASQGMGYTRRGSLVDDLREIQQMERAGMLDQAEAVRARGALLRSVSDAVVLDEAPAPCRAPDGGGTLLTVGAVAVALVALAGATPEMLICIGMAALATVAIAACWQA